MDSGLINIFEALGFEHKALSLLVKVGLHKVLVHHLGVLHSWINCVTSSLPLSFFISIVYWFLRAWFCVPLWVRGQSGRAARQATTWVYVQNHTFCGHHAMVPKVNALTLTPRMAPDTWVPLRSTHLLSMGQDTYMRKQQLSLPLTCQCHLMNWSSQSHGTWREVISQSLWRILS